MREPRAPFSIAKIGLVCSAIGRVIGSAVIGPAVIGSAVLGCVSLPGRRFAIDDVSVSGNHALGDSEIEEQIATRPSPKFLGLFRGVVYDYTIFDRYVLERDLQRIERYYHSWGYYSAHVHAGRVFNTSARHVRVQILVEEGEPTRLARVDVHGLDGLPPDLVQAALRAVDRALPLGDRFEEAKLDDGVRELQAALENNGYAYARVRPSADVDMTRKLASVGYWVEPGQSLRIGELRVSGLGAIPKRQIERTLGLTPGTVYSREKLDDARSRVIDLGVFSSVSVEPAPRGATAAGANDAVLVDAVPVDVKLEPARFGSVRLGAGVEIDSQHTDVHLVSGWEDKNFLGGLRSLQVEFLPGAVIWPTRLPDLLPPERLLPQARLRVEFRQPGLFEAATYGVVRMEAGLAPVLLSSARDPSAPILGYRDLRASAGVDRSLYRKLHGSLTENVQLTDPFAYTGTLDPDLSTVLVSYPELLLRLDARNDPIEPSSGLYASTSIQVAGAGGSARDLKLQPELRGYVPLGHSTVLAARGTVGFLAPQNYGDTIATDAVTGNGGADRASWVRDVELMYLRGFFGGGPGSNRGYALREVGPHGAVPFYNPGLSSEESSANCDVSRASASGALPADCNLPLGGFSLWEASLELRFPIMSPLRGALFVDSGDVSPYKFNLRWDHPHLSAGLGLRYGTPIGPVRVDVGYRLPGLQAPATADEYSPAKLFGLPVALSIGIGEPF